MKNIVYILLLIPFFYSCNTKTKINTKGKIVLETKGISIIKPDIFVVYLNIDIPARKEKKECAEYVEDIEKEINLICKQNKIEKYKVEQSQITQNKSYTITGNKSEKFKGYYCSSAIAVTLENQNDFNFLYPILIEKFEVASHEIYSSKIDSLNLSAYRKALQNADILSDQFLNTLKANTKKVIKITNLNTENTNNEAFFIFGKSPSWMFSGSFLQAKEFLNKSYIIAEKKIIVEYEIE